MTKFNFCLVDALEKILPNRQPNLQPPISLRGFAGEELSFQLAYICSNDDLGDTERTFCCEACSDLDGAHLMIQRTGLVPCSYPCHGTYDDNYLSTKPGLYPDLLIPLSQDEKVKAIPNQWRSIFITIQLPATVRTGSYTVSVKASPCDGSSKSILDTQFYVCDKLLPKQRIFHTEWFHTDCLADYYHVPVFSEKHWEIISNFMESAHQHRINMLLTPLFTPPLDTEKGGERTTVQLIGIRKTGTEYRFDFSKLHRWIGLCEEHQIEYLEMAHLFSQWGAMYAPKVMGTDDAGNEVQLFGWNNSATSEEYCGFLHCFIPQLKAFLLEEGWLNRTWFHISDEPHDNEMETFAKAKQSVDDLLADCQVMDALSSYEIYRQGYVRQPVVSVDHIEKFIDNKVPHLWAYYCTCQAIDVPNRFMAMPSTRNRVIGVLLYYYAIEGFLHWGFNFYNSQCSRSHIDPYKVTDAGDAFPSGDPFLVYPAPDGTAYDSIRGMILKEAFEDYRALTLLEEKIGRDAVLKILEDLCGSKPTFEKYPCSIDFFANMRKAITERLECNI